MDRTTAISRHRRLFLRHFCSSHFSYIGYILLYCGKILHNGKFTIFTIFIHNFSGIHTRTLWCSHPAIHLQNFLLPHTEILYPLHNNHPFTSPSPPPRNHSSTFYLCDKPHSLLHFNESWSLTGSAPPKSAEGTKDNASQRAQAGGYPNAE